MAAQATMLVILVMQYRLMLNQMDYSVVRELVGHGIGQNLA